MKVPLRSARAAKKALIDHFQLHGWLMLTPPTLYTGDHEEIDPDAWVLSWEEGPDEWVYNEGLRECIDEAFRADLRAVHPNITGHAEPINHWCLGLYAYSISDNEPEEVGAYVRAEEEPLTYGATLEFEVDYKVFECSEEEWLHHFTNTAAEVLVSQYLNCVGSDDQWHKSEFGYDEEDDAYVILDPDTTWEYNIIGRKMGYVEWRVTYDLK